MNEAYCPFLSFGKFGLGETTETVMRVCIGDHCMCFVPAVFDRSIPSAPLVSKARCGLVHI